MLDAKRRLQEAQQALHSLELQIEQYRIHISELGAHPEEAERARAALTKLEADRATQRTYCALLAKADPTGDPMVKNGSRVA